MQEHEGSGTISAQPTRFWFFTAFEVVEYSDKDITASIPGCNKRVLLNV